VAARCTAVVAVTVKGEDVFRSSTKDEKDVVKVAEASTRGVAPAYKQRSAAASASRVAAGNETHVSRPFSFRVAGSLSFSCRQCPRLDEPARGVERGAEVLRARAKHDFVRRENVFKRVFGYFGAVGMKKNVGARFAFRERLQRVRQATDARARFRAPEARAVRELVRAALGRELRDFRS
jgi:hypothetical protein